MTNKLQKNADFTVMIPTYNRCNFLKMAMRSVLRQKGVSLELLISDNCSSDDTKKVVKSFEDKRIRYIRNKRNLEYGPNAVQCFRKATGKYIFMLSDDDFILYEDTLFDILKTMKKYHVAVGRLGSIAYDKSTKLPYRTTILSDKLVVLKPKKDKEIIFKTMDFNLGFFSGIIFDHALIDKNKMSEHSGFIYFPFSYDAILKHGIAFIPRHFIISHLSIREWEIYFDIKKHGSFFLEDILPIVREYTDDKEYDKYKKEHILRSIILLPNLKYFTNNINYLKILQRFILLDNSMLINPNFIMFAISGFLPKIIIKGIRDFVVYNSYKKTKEEVKKYDYLQNINELGFN